MTGKRKQKNKDLEPVIIKVESRNFATNQSVYIGKVPATIEGYFDNNLNTLVRIQVSNLENGSQKYIRQFKCLTPNARISGLYVINEKEIMRQNNNEWQKGKAPKDTQKRIKRNR